MVARRIRLLSIAMLFGICYTYGKSNGGSVRMEDARKIRRLLYQRQRERLPSSGQRSRIRRNLGKAKQKIYKSKGNGKKKSKGKGNGVKKHGKKGKKSYDSFYSYYYYDWDGYWYHYHGYYDDSSDEVPATYAPSRSVSKPSVPVKPPSPSSSDHPVPGPGETPSPSMLPTIPETDDTLTPSTAARPTTEPTMTDTDATISPTFTSNTGGPTSVPTFTDSDETIPPTDAADSPTVSPSTSTATPTLAPTQEHPATPEPSAGSTPIIPVETPRPTLEPTLAFDLSNCQSYNLQWLFDLAGSCDDNLEGCRCTTAEVMLEVERIDCATDSCPQECPVCDFCISLICPT